MIKEGLLLTKTVIVTILNATSKYTNQTQRSTPKYISYHYAVCEDRNKHRPGDYTDSADGDGFLCRCVCVCVCCSAVGKVQCDAPDTFPS